MVKKNGLSIVLLALFLLSMLGQIAAGRLAYNEEQAEHGQPQVSLSAYLLKGHFWEATGENLESEFLQMAAFVLLTVGLRQKGSAESKKLDSPEAVDADPRANKESKTPWPVRQGGLALSLYENSLSIALVALFAVSFALHAIGGAKEYNDEQQAHGQSDQVSVAGYIATPRFWFESFQNWQSEFLSLGVMVVFTIALRQRGSPESKPVAAPHEQTGSD